MDNCLSGKYLPADPEMKAPFYPHAFDGVAFREIHGRHGYQTVSKDLAAALERAVRSSEPLHAAIKHSNMSLFPRSSHRHRLVDDYNSAWNTSKSVRRSAGPFRLAAGDALRMKPRVRRVIRARLIEETRNGIKYDPPTL